MRNNCRRRVSRKNITSPGGVLYISYYIVPKIANAIELLLTLYLNVDSGRNEIEGKKPNRKIRHVLLCVVRRTNWFLCFSTRFMFYFHKWKKKNKLNWFKLLNYVLRTNRVFACVRRWLFDDSTRESPASRNGMRYEYRSVIIQEISGGRGRILTVERRKNREKQNMYKSTTVLD